MQQKRSNLALIPARGGSKRIANKNIRDFLGKPIIAYSIQAAIDSGLFNEIMVSTDSDEIADIAVRFGAKVPFLRSQENSNDFATLADVVDEVKKEYNTQNKSFDNICCILPTAPLITVSNLKKAYELLINNNVDSVRPVVRFSYPIQRAVKMIEGNISLFYPEYQDTRSQDLEFAYHDSGQFYWMRSDSGLRGVKKMGFEIPEICTQDIDSYNDWNLAEHKYNYLKDNKLI
jgi:N-acylneuraminate cytidylyltransferase